MVLSNIFHKGFKIQKRIDIKTNTSIIYKYNKIVKCIVGDISIDGIENSIEKSKKFIDNLTTNRHN